MLTPHDLSLEFLESTYGIAPGSLRFCWKLHRPLGDEGRYQSAYRLRVASTLESCLGEAPDLWDSGRVESTETLYLPYGGKTLKPFDTAYWSVTVWDENGKASAPTHCPEPLSIAPMQELDWSAKWIGAKAWDKPGPTPAWFRGKWGDVSPQFDENEEAPAIYLRRSFLVRHPVKKALLSICGLGCYVANVNAKRVSACMELPFSAYDKTVLFRTFDVTDGIEIGENVLSTVLGNGLYNQVVPDFFSYEQAPWKGSPRMICHLHLRYADGSTEGITSDESWRVSTDGPIRYTDLRGGETIDHRFELGNWQHPGFDDSHWSSATLATPPKGRLQPDPTPSFAVSEVRPAKHIQTLSDGRIVVDFGGPLAGFVKLNVTGQSDGVVTVRFSEALDADGSLDLRANRSHTFGRYQVDRFLPKGGADPEIFETTFSRHAFRYVQVEGLKQPLEYGHISAFRTTNKLRPTGFFACSDPLLVSYHDAARRTLEDCTAGLPCAEPVREKIAWAGDMTFLQPAYCYLFDSAALYRRTVAELASSQDALGHLPPVHPCGGWGRLDDAGAHEFCDDAWWGGSLAESAEALALHYGDPDAARDSSDASFRYLAYLAGTRDHDGCVSWGLGDWCDREWKDGRAGLTEVAFTATLGLNRLATLAANLLARQGLSEAALRYRQLSEEAAQAVRRRYWRENGFEASSQTMQALPISLGILSDEERKEAERRLLANIDSLGGRLSIGFIGLVPVLRVLADLERADLALHALMHVPDSGLRLCLECSGEPPTLGETIHARLIDVHSGAGSFHHQFGATATAFIYEGLAGIRPDPAAPGWKHFFIRPAIGCGLQQMSLTYESPRGTIRVKWDHDGPQCDLMIEVPANTTASLRVPGTFLSNQELGPGVHDFRYRAKSLSHLQ